MPRVKTKTPAKKTPARKAFVPTTATVDYGHEYPRIPVSPPFVLVYNPQRWTLLGGRVVPALHKIPLQPGVKGVTYSKGRGWNLAKLKHKLAEQGRHMLPWSLGPDGSYVAVVETRTDSGAVVDTHVSAFADTFAGSSEVRADTEAYVAWLEELMKEGNIPAPPPFVLEKLLADRRNALLAAKTDAKRKQTPTADALVHSLEAAVATLEGLVSETKKTPAKRRAAAPMVAE